MKNLPLFLLTTCLNFIFISCQPTGPEKKQPDKKNEAFFPIHDFIEGQVKAVDSMPLAIYRMTSDGSRQDSQIVERDVFKMAAEEFLKPDIGSEELKSHYTENLYMDETIRMVVLSYSANDEQVEVKKTEIYVNPENDKVKSLYIEKENVKGDTLIRKKLYWKTDRNFQIVELREVPDKPSITRVEKFIWDNRD